MTDVDPVPTTPAEFVAAMRILKAAAHVGFRTLEKRALAAGDVLPKSTLIAVLSRDTLPREEVVAAFVRACGLSEDAVGRWLAVRRRVAGVPVAGDPTSVDAPPLAIPDLAVDPGPPHAAEGSSWLGDLVPPAIRRGSWPLRLTAMLLVGLVVLVTMAAVVGTVRDWTQPAPDAGPGAVSAGPGGVDPEWTVVSEGELSLRDQQGVDFDTMRIDVHVPGYDLELLQWGKRLNAAKDIALLTSSGVPGVRRCLGAAVQGWDGVLDGVDRFAPGQDICVVTDTGLVVLLTVVTAPDSAQPVVVCHYVVWRRAA